MKRKYISWEKIQNFDDIILMPERKIISKLEKEAQKNKITLCPCLKKIGQFWHYCIKGLKGEIDEKPLPSNPIYHRKVDVIELQLHCMDEYKSCCFYSGKLKR